MPNEKATEWRRLYAELQSALTIVPADKAKLDALGDALSRLEDEMGAEWLENRLEELNG